MQNCSFVPSQAIYSIKNPNMPPEWNLGFGNCILPFAETVRKIQSMGLSHIPVISPFFDKADCFKIFEENNNYLYMQKENDLETLKKNFQKIIYTSGQTNEEEYLEHLKRYSSLLIIEPFSTHDDFDIENWKRKNRPGAIFRKFDLNDSVQMDIVNKCITLRDDIQINPFDFDEESKKIQLFLRFGLYGGDTQEWIRQEYPGKLFSDRLVGISSGDLEKEDSRMPLSLVVNTLKTIIGEDERKVHVNICSDFSGTPEQNEVVSKWFQDQFDEREIEFSFRKSPSLWSDLYGGVRQVETIIGGSSDFLRVAAAKNIGSLESRNISHLKEVYLPKIDPTRENFFLQPNLEEMQQIYTLNANLR